jgi:hypothetical protein
MIDLDVGDNGAIKLGKKIEEIQKFEVWWISPKGLHGTLEEAKTVCKELDLESIMIKPVCVAVSSSTYEVMLR